MENFSSDQLKELKSMPLDQRLAKVAEMNPSKAISNLQERSKRIINNEATSQTLLDMLRVEIGPIIKKRRTRKLNSGKKLVYETGNTSLTRISRLLNASGQKRRTVDETTTVLRQRRTNGKKPVQETKKNDEKTLEQYEELLHFTTNTICKLSSEFVGIKTSVENFAQQLGMAEIGLAEFLNGNTNLEKERNQGTTRAKRTLFDMHASSSKIRKED